MKQRYQVMSVPCIIVSQNGQETVSFGRKDINQLIEML
jgi:thioredoxin reductase (NADPH)